MRQRVFAACVILVLVSGAVSLAQVEDRRPSLGSVDLSRILLDAEERASIEETIDEYQNWWDRHPSDPRFFYGLDFTGCPKLNHGARLNVSAGPGFAPAGMFVAWIRIPPGFGIIEGDTVDSTYTMPVSVESMEAAGLTYEEMHQHLAELKENATVRLDLGVVAEAEGVHVFRAYAIMECGGGKLTAGYRDFWVMVRADTAHVSRSASFYKWPGSTGIGRKRPGTPPEEGDELSPGREKIDLD